MKFKEQALLKGYYGTSIGKCDKKVLPVAKNNNKGSYTDRYVQTNKGIVSLCLGRRERFQQKLTYFTLIRVMFGDKISIQRNTRDIILIKSIVTYLSYSKCPGLWSLKNIWLNLQFSLFMSVFQTFFHFECIPLLISRILFSIVKSTIIFVATFCWV